MRGTPQDDDAELYSKSSTLQMWLFGYEFPDTLLVFTRKTFIVVTSKSKGAFEPRPVSRLQRPCI